MQTFDPKRTSKELVSCTNAINVAAREGERGEIRGFEGADRCVVSMFKQCVPLPVMRRGGVMGFEASHCSTTYLLLTQAVCMRRMQL